MFYTHPRAVPLYLVGRPEIRHPYTEITVLLTNFSHPVDQTVLVYSV